MQVSEYYNNGSIKNLTTQVNINLKKGGITSSRTGEYKEYYENGNIKVDGHYLINRRVGIWKWYYEDGKFKTEFDYKDGTAIQ